MITDFIIPLQAISSFRAAVKAWKHFDGNWILGLTKAASTLVKISIDKGLQTSKDHTGISDPRSSRIGDWLLLLKIFCLTLRVVMLYVNNKTDKSTKNGDEAKPKITP